MPFEGAIIHNVTELTNQFAFVDAATKVLIVNTKTNALIVFIEQQAICFVFPSFALTHRNGLLCLEG